MRAAVPRHLHRLAALALAGLGRSAQAELVDITWDPAGRFETTMNIAPGKFAEVCGSLTKGQSVAWSFKGNNPTNFNIHYHEGKQVVFPVQQDGLSDAQGKLQVNLTQDYCWMWTNKSTARVTLQVQLQR